MSACFYRLPLKGPGKPVPIASAMCLSDSHGKVYDVAVTGFRAGYGSVERTDRPCSLVGLPGNRRGGALDG
jgi:hypothetical protein